MAIEELHHAEKTAYNHAQITVVRQNNETTKDFLERWNSAFDLKMKEQGWSYQGGFPWFTEHPQWPRFLNCIVFLLFPSRALK